MTHPHIPDAWRAEIRAAAKARVQFCFSRFQGQDPTHSGPASGIIAAAIPADGGKEFNLFIFSDN